MQAGHPGGTALGRAAEHARFIVARSNPRPLAGTEPGHAAAASRCLGPGVPWPPETGNSGAHLTADSTPRLGRLQPDNGTRAPSRAERRPLS